MRRNKASYCLCCAYCNKTEIIENYLEATILDYNGWEIRDSGYKRILTCPECLDKIKKGEINELYI